MKAVDQHFKTKLEHFDYRARRGALALDRSIDAVAKRRGKSVDVAGLRRDFWRAAFMSSLEEEDRHKRPSWRTETEKYLGHLSAANQSLQNASVVDTQAVFRSLIRLPDEPGDLSQHLTRQVVEREFYELNAFLSAAHRRIAGYLDMNALPPPRRPGSNAADYLVRNFIDLSRIAWERGFGEKLVSDDLADFVSLLGAALDEFGYPLSAKQRQSDDGWLRDRARKQLFPSPRKRAIRK